MEATLQSELPGELFNTGDLPPDLKENEEGMMEVRPGVRYEVMPDHVLKVYPLFERSGSPNFRASTWYVRGTRIRVSRVKLVSVYEEGEIQIAVLSEDYNKRIGYRGTGVRVSDIQQNCERVEE